MFLRMSFSLSEITTIMMGGNQADVGGNPRLFTGGCETFSRITGQMHPAWNGNLNWESLWGTSVYGESLFNCSLTPHTQLYEISSNQMGGKTVQKHPRSSIGYWKTAPRSEEKTTRNWAWTHSDPIGVRFLSHCWAAGKPPWIEWALRTWCNKNVAPGPRYVSQSNRSSQMGINRGCRWKHD